MRELAIVALVMLVLAYIALGMLGNGLAEMVRAFV